VIRQPATGRRRVRCEGCAPTRVRPGRKVTPLPAPVAAADGPGPVSEATLAELVDAGRESTSTAREALLLAGLLDAGGYTAQGAAALARARRDALAVALAGAPSKADRLDELRARRQAKAARA
jgi:hypothetical protein